MGEGGSGVKEVTGVRLALLVRLRDAVGGGVAVPVEDSDGEAEGEREMGAL